MLLFLMHRVELKVLKNIPILGYLFSFLMHRVELKVAWKSCLLPQILVPNAPCGVERWLLERRQGGPGPSS